MGDREFEKWALKQEMSIAPSVFRGATFDNKVTEGALLGWQARQPEIDALKEKVASGVASIKGYAAENAALKAEVERTRFHCGLYTSIRAYYLKNREHPHGCYARPLPNGGTVSSAATTEDEYDASMCKCFAIDAAMKETK